MPVAAEHIPRSCVEARAVLCQALSVSELTGLSGDTKSLTKLALSLGVKRIVTRSLNVSGMLIPSEDGYVIAIKEDDSERKRRYSLAHEIGHLAIASRQQHGGSYTKHRVPTSRYDHGDKHEERLCEAIAAELLMPVEAFRRQVSEVGSTLSNIPYLSDIFQTSITSTAIRYCELLPEPCLLVRWRSDRRRGGILVPDWQIRNEVSGPFVQVLPKGAKSASPQITGADTAYSSQGLITSYESLLTRVSTRRGRHVVFPRYKVESKGFGISKNRFVVSVVYLRQELSQ